MKTFKKLLILVMGLSIGALAQSPQRLSATIDKEAIRIGEPIKYTIKYPKSIPTSLWPKWKDSVGKFEVIEVLGVDTLLDAYQQNILLTVFDSGVWIIPALSIDSGRFLSDTLSVYCNTVEVDTTQAFKPIYGLREVEKTYSPWTWVIVGLLLLGALAAFYAFMKNKKKSKALNVASQTPYERAMSELDEIASKKEWENDDMVKDYYAKITDVMRKYFHEEYQVNAMESTSQELLERIKKITKLHQKRKEIASVLQNADLAKFAKTRPNMDENVASLSRVKDIIMWAKPMPEPIEDPKKKSK